MNNQGSSQRERTLLDVYCVINNLVIISQATPERRSKKYPELEQLEAELVAARDARKREKNQKRMLLAEASGEGREKRKEKRRRKNEEKEAKKKKEEGESEEDCSAKNPRCRRPTGRQVHWVQCDGCQLWFHLFCIGVRPSQISEEEDFMCGDCEGIKKVDRAGPEGGAGKDPAEAVGEMDVGATRV